MRRALFGLIRKEFIQVFRDVNMVRIIFLIPVVQLIIFGYVANTEVENIALDVYDFDRSHQSRRFVQSFKPGTYFVPTDAPESLFEYEPRFIAGDAEMVLIIPNQFERQLLRGESPRVGLIVDGANANAAAIGIGYAGQIVGRYSADIYGTRRPVELSYRVLYNPEGESVYFMVPGVVATLLTMITVVLTAMAIVREREAGTLEQLMVTPISTPAFLMGKVLPFAALGFFELVVVLLLGVWWFSVPFIGSPFLLFSLSALYLLTTLGIGLFFSTVTSTQQQAMFFAWFFSVFAILTSGFFTPIANMPEWLQYVTYVNPMRFFLSIVRSIMMRDAGFMDMLPDIVSLAVYGIAIFTLSALRFSKRTG